MGKFNKESLLLRSVSGVLFLVVMVGALLLSYYTFVALLMFITAMATKEFYKIASTQGAKPQQRYGIATAVVVVLTAGVVALWGLEEWCSKGLVGLSIAMVFLTFMAELYRKNDNPIANIATTITGVLYVALPFSLLLLLSTWELPFGSSNVGFGTAGVGTAEFNPMVILLYFIIVWGNDVGAFITGIALGRTKLFERISPNKTWEGFIGGVLIATLLGGVGGWLMGGTRLAVWFWIGAAVVTALSAVAGDLTESMFKRSAGVKDSGNMMPGHGGYLDRFDATIYSAPFIFVYFFIFFG